MILRRHRWRSSAAFPENAANAVPVLLTALFCLFSCRPECVLGESACKSLESDPEDFSDEANTENLYGTSPPSTPRQMKRLSTKHQRNSLGRPASRSNLKGEPAPKDARERVWGGVPPLRDCIDL